MFNSDMYMARERISDMLRESERDYRGITFPFEEELVRYSFDRNSLLLRLIHFIKRSESK